MLRQLNHSVVVRVVAFVVAFAALGGCTLTTDVNKPGAIIRYTGDGQSAPVNTALPSPFQIIVVNAFGERLKDATVTWSIATGGGTLSATTTLTDPSGIAEVNYTTGPAAGTEIVNAQVHGILPLSFTVTVTP